MLFLLTAVMAGSCSSDPLDIADEKEGMAYICLNVGLLADRADGTRSMKGDKDYFEQATDKYEKIHTLRIFIVRPDGTIEHNRRYDFGTKEVASMSDIYRVKKNEVKDIYLFANELEAPLNGSGFIDFDSEAYLAGKPFNKETINSLTLVANESNYLFVNSADDDGKNLYVPANEHFSVELTSDQPGTPLEPSQTFSMFVTRSASKFSFTAKLDESYPEGSIVTINEITITDIADKEYLLPNNTIYDPEWTSSEVNPADAREITFFYSPNDAAYSPLVFNPSGFSAQKEKPAVYSPMLYCCETNSRANGISVALKATVKNGTNSEESDVMFGPVQLPNENVSYRIARNSHVVLNFTFAPKSISLNAIVMPYIGVPLDPVFGFDEWVQPPIVDEESKYKES